MNKTLKIIFSLPSLLLVFFIPFNFFNEYSQQEENIILNFIIIIAVIYFLTLPYILYKLWGNKYKSIFIKIIWTILMIFCFQPIATLIYLWIVESGVIKKE